MSRHDPDFTHANAILPQSASTGAFPRALASRAAQTAFANNLQRARDELDAEGPRGLEREARERERELLARRQSQMPPNVPVRGGPDVPVSSLNRKRMMDDSWRAEEEDAAAQERENKRLRPQQRPAFSQSNSGGDPNAGSPHPPPAGRNGNGIGSGASGD